MRFRAKQAFLLAKKYPTEIKLGEVSTDKGVLYYADDTLIEGADVWMIGSEGEQVVPEDGEYVDGSDIIVVKNGVVDELKKITEETVTDSITEVPLEATEVVEEVPNPETSDMVSVEKFNDLLEVVESIKEDHNELVEEVKELTDELVQATVELKAIMKLSNAEFVHPVEVDTVKLSKAQQKVKQIFNK